MPNIERLIGDDGFLIFDEVGTEVVGDAMADLDDLNGDGVGSGAGVYQVTAIATSSSVFDWTGPKVGDYFYDDGLLVLAVGDKAIQITGSSPASAGVPGIKSFEITPSRSKIDVSGFTDTTMVYRFGKSDMSGTMTGVTVIGTQFYNLAKRFIERLAVAKDGAFTMHRIDNNPLYFVGYLQEDTREDETLLMVVGKVGLENFQFGAQDGSAQEFTCNFAPFAGDKMQLISVINPAAA